MIETFEDIKGELEAVNRRTDHGQKKNVQVTIFKTLNRKLKIE